MDQMSLVLQHFQNEKDFVEVFWNIDKNPTAAIWAKLLKSSLDQKAFFHPRYTGFLHGPKNMAYMTDLLNRCIDIINTGDLYKIKERAEGKWSQEFSNIIHHHFEILCGTVENHSEIYKKSSPEIRNAIRGLNQVTHDMEAFYRAKERVEHFPETYFSSIIMQNKDGKRYEFPDFVYDQFKLATKFGAVHLNYFQIGKTWWEVFLDEDEEIFPEAISPHRVMSGGFDIFFGEYSPPPEVWQRFERFLLAHGQNIHDKKLCIGYCQVAQLANPDKYSREQWRLLIGEHCHVKEIRLHNEGQIVSRLELPAKIGNEF